MKHIPSQSKLLVRTIPPHKSITVVKSLNLRQLFTNLDPQQFSDTQLKTTIHANNLIVKEILTVPCSLKSSISVNNKRWDTSSKYLQEYLNFNFLQLMKNYSYFNHFGFSKSCLFYYCRMTIQRYDNCDSDSAQQIAKTKTRITTNAISCKEKLSVF